MVDEFEIKGKTAGQDTPLDKTTQNPEFGDAVSLNRAADTTFTNGVENARQAEPIDYERFLAGMPPVADPGPQNDIHQACVNEVARQAGDYANYMAQQRGLDPSLFNSLRRAA